MNGDANVKQQIVERIKQSSNILVTVSRDPSVDELTSALGLTLMLNNLKKHATAVASGRLPSAIDFLEPGKTFENTVDSLRDFIIALDKEKADHLRYKVDGDVVKIFITPYRTMISENDLEFSQGDYNVELVLALGVKSKDHLDSALESHGRILHDATVVSLSAGDETSKLGTLNWSEASASSISEMLVSLSEALKEDKPLLDEPIATAFLTGIVAATDRFSNNKTSSKVMTMAAQLMAAGANQQLIAAKLEEAHEISSDEPTTEDDKTDANSDGTTSLAEGAGSKIDKKAKTEEVPETPDSNGGLSIQHDTDTQLAKAEQAVAQQSGTDAAEKAESALASQLEAVAPAAVSPSPSVDDLKKDLASATADVEEAAAMPAAPSIDTSNSSVEVPMPDYEPTIGGTLNATTEQAADEKRREAQSTQNRTILSHDNSSAENTDNGPMHNTGPVFTPPPFSASTQTTAEEEPEMSPLIPSSEPEVQVAPVDTPTPNETLADLDRQNRAPHDEARAAVEAAFNDAPFNPANNPTIGVGAQSFGETVAHDAPADVASLAPNATELPPLPDFTALPPPPPPAFGPAPASQPEQLGQIFGEAQAGAPATAPETNDPGQFKIPGQG
jgi:hypothetical protein